jgi:predicted phosphodiesterase
MRTLVISDLHSNSDALRAVLTHVKRKRIERVFCLGDFVGYGAQPNQVLDQVRTIRADKIFVRGNHDRVVAGFEDGEAFNHAARSAALWTRDRLSGPNRDFLKKLPIGPIDVGEGVIVCHGSPVDEDQYLFSEADAYNTLQRFPEARLIFFGHTHLPAVFSVGNNPRLSAKIYRQPATVKLDPTRRYLINPGSVGQPRDRNTMAASLLYDSEKQTVQFLRVEYDIESAQLAILRAGLPRILADRLSYGT